MTTTSSLTARTAAAARAAHLIVDEPPLIFADPLAERLLGGEAEELLSYHRLHGSHVVLAGARAQVTCRSRYAEDHLASAVADGIRQYVILGAGLDSFAYRSPVADQVAIFEVDMLATLDDKRARLSAAQLEVPDNVVFVAVDFESGSLSADLANNGLDLSEPAFVSWLGVTMYLSRDALGATFKELSRLGSGTQVVADYMLPAELRDEAGETYVELVAPSSAERGEPWLSFLSPVQMSELLASHGFATLRQVAQRDVGDTQMWHRSDALRPANLSVIAHAATCGVRG